MRPGQGGRLYWIPDILFCLIYLFSFREYVLSVSSPFRSSHLATLIHIVGKVFVIELLEHENVGYVYKPELSHFI